MAMLGQRSGPKLSMMMGSARASGRVVNPPSPPVLTPEELTQKKLQERQLAQARQASEKAKKKAADKAKKRNRR